MTIWIWDKLMSITAEHFAATVGVIRKNTVSLQFAPLAEAVLLFTSFAHKSQNASFYFFFVQANEQSVCFRVSNPMN